MSVRAVRRVAQRAKGEGGFARYCSPTVWCFPREKKISIDGSIVSGIGEGKQCTMIMIYLARSGGVVRV